MVNKLVNLLRLHVLLVCLFFFFPFLFTKIFPDSDQTAFCQALGNTEMSHHGGGHWVHFVNMSTAWCSVPLAEQAPPREQCRSQWEALPSPPHGSWWKVGVKCSPMDPQHALVWMGWPLKSLRTEATRNTTQIWFNSQCPVSHVYKEQDMSGNWAFLFSLCLLEMGVMSSLSLMPSLTWWEVAWWHFPLLLCVHSKFLRKGAKGPSACWLGSERITCTRKWIHICRDTPQHKGYHLTQQWETWEHAYHRFEFGYCTFSVGFISFNFWYIHVSWSDKA